MTRRFLLTLLLPVGLCLTGCSSSTAIDTLNATVAAADAAVNSLEINGIVSQADALLTVNYLSAVAVASQSAAVELASADTAAIKATKITAYFANAAAPAISSAPPAVQASLAAVSAAVNAFLVSLAPASTPAFAGRVIRPSLAQRYQLDRIRRHADHVFARVSAYRTR